MFKSTCISISQDKNVTFTITLDQGSNAQNNLDSTAVAQIFNELSQLGMFDSKNEDDPNSNDDFINSDGAVNSKKYSSKTNLDKSVKNETILEQNDNYQPEIEWEDVDLLTELKFEDPEVIDVELEELKCNVCRKQFASVKGVQIHIGKMHKKY